MTVKMTSLEVATGLKVKAIFRGRHFRLIETNWINGARWLFFDKNDDEMLKSI